MRLLRVVWGPAVDRIGHVFKGIAKSFCYPPRYKIGCRKITWRAS
jgi:hypothetical protein